MSQQPKPVRILIRKLLRTEDDILRFCKANRATILECGQYLYVFDKSDFNESILRWFYTNDNLAAAYDCFGCLKLNSGQIKELLDDLSEGCTTEADCRGGLPPPALLGGGSTVA